MVRRIAKYGWKSGILPRLKKVVPTVKAPFEVPADYGLRVTFKDPAMAPKGLAINVPEKVDKSVQEILDSSAALPKSRKNTENMTESEKWRRLTADIRRTYHRESLEIEGTREKLRAQRRQARHEASETLKENMKNLQETPAALLTMPTIESSLLQGTMIVPRTEEETRLLKLKRQANRKALELKIRKNKMDQVLELYESGKSWCLTEEELDAQIQRAFAPGAPTKASFNTQAWARLDETTERAKQIDMAFFGTTRSGGPSLAKIQEHMDIKAQS